MSKIFHLTTPLFQLHRAPGLGDSYTAVIGDSISRYKKMSGAEVCALTGVDEHGPKVERLARQTGTTPQQWADKYSEEFKKAWNELGLRYDEFMRTTDQRHVAAVQEFYRRLETRKFVYLAEYSGGCCTYCQAQTDLEQQTCPQCGRPTEQVREESYFFRLSSFQEKLLGFYQDNPDFVMPPVRMSEIVSFVKGGLKDVSISRTSLSWGIRVPGDDKHVFYGWFDALVGYLSGVGFPHDMARVARLWPADVQLSGKESLPRHAVYWLALLMAAGLEPPRHILAHGSWGVDGNRESETVTAAELAELLPADYIKYFLLRELPLEADGSFSYGELISCVNSDLSNELGNLATRILKMIENYFQNVIPEPGAVEGGDEELRRFTRETAQLYRENFDRLHITKSLDSIWELISVTNKYVVANEPWLLARDTLKTARLGTVLYHSAEALRIVATMLGPFVPDGSSAILRQLGIEQPPDNFKFHALNWGELTPGNRISSSEAVYPRVDPTDFQSKLAAARERRKEDDAKGPATSMPEGQMEQISIEDFAKVELRVGKVVSAERVPQSEKLLRLQVDIGTEIRQVVAGIGKAYAPESLPGRVVVVVTNLKPAKLMGVTSNGMIVAASEGGVPVLATFTEPVVVGSRLK